MSSKTDVVRVGGVPVRKQTSRERKRFLRERIQKLEADLRTFYNELQKVEEEEQSGRS